MSAPAFPEPVFIGGPGRSGTHIMGRLLAASPRYHLIRTEARFHASNGGLPDLLAGTVSMEDFLARMRGYWWQRGYGQRQGLQRVIDEQRREAALAEFEEGFARDPRQAARRLIRALLDPAAESDGKPAWVEVTGQAIERAPFLLELLPNARFINMVRDGRAVVAGMLRKVDMTDDPGRALQKWEQMVRASDAALRAVPAGTMLTIHLDDFTSRDREGTFRRVVEFLEIDDEDQMRKYFKRRVSAEAAHVGKWRERVAPQDARLIDRRYRRMIRRLRREGVT
ncbi:MAG TPA: sulfotransferase, partial [Thermoleophilaceae bacterium]|nr:sulfotransferase [Thermoleophilaceae bacterium]